jgi:hypothetical protein
MTASADTLKAFTDAAADAVARAIAGVQREASRLDELRAAEHRAFMAEQRETLADLTRRVEVTLANVKDGKDGRDGRDGVDGVGLNGKDGRDGKDGASFDQARADRELELRAAEHRAFMAEQREIIAGLLRQVEDLKATVKDGKDGRGRLLRTGGHDPPRLNPPPKHPDWAALTGGLFYSGAADVR